MLRQKISIVLAPKVMKEIQSIGDANQIRETEFLTMFIEEIFIHKKDELMKIVQGISLDIPKDFGRLVDYNEVQLPYEMKEIKLPDICPECGESEDILGNKVLYQSGGSMHCKACLMSRKI